MVASLPVFRAGTHDGRISRTVQSADGSLSPLETIVYVGDRHSEANATFPCGTEQSEDKCGRPLGMTFATAGELKGKLIVADCTRGLLAVDVDTRAKTLLTEQVDGLPVFFTNSVVVGPRTGKIYFTDSSQRWRRTDFIFECMESRPTGRLIEYDPKTKQARTLVDDVAFANGLLVDPDETYILFVELNRAQILRVDLAAVAKRPGKTPIHWNARRCVRGVRMRARVLHAFLPTMLHVDVHPLLTPSASLVRFLLLPSLPFLRLVGRWTTRRCLCSSRTFPASRTT